MHPVLVERRRSLAHGWATVTAMTLVLLATLLVTVAVPPSDVADAAPNSTRYVPVTPIRVLDTSSDAGRKKLAPNSSITIEPVTAAVAGAAGVAPADIKAVAINLTVFNTNGAGFTSVFPAGGKLPLVSSVNNDAAGQFIPNVAIVKLGTDRAITVYSLSGADIIVDVQGVLVAATESRAGRYVALEPVREIDTRTFGRPILSRSTRTLDLSRAGVPADAIGAVLNVTVTETRGPGYVTVFRSGARRPDPTSNVNYPSAGYTVANSVITGVDNGLVDVFALTETHLIVDVLGYITGQSAESSSAGLYVPLDPRRFYDSRPNETPRGSAPIGQGQHRSIPILGRGSVPATGVAAIAMNLGLTGAPQPGFLAAYPQGTIRPTPYSTVNISFPFQTAANHTISQVSTAGGIDVYSRLLADTFVDVTGYFLGEPVVPPPPLVVAPKPDLVPPIPPIPPTDFDFAFSDPSTRGGISGLDGTRYIGWNPCTPITYAVNADQANQDQVNALNKAIRQVELATGIDFRFLGRVTGDLLVPLNFNDPAFIENPLDAQAVFGFSTAALTPALQGSTIGVGGIWKSFFVPGDNSTIYYQRDGMAIADIEDIPGGNELVAVFMHEIGHMLGLAHVPIGTGELMEPILQAQTTFGNGDLNGLRRAGRAACGSANLVRSLAADGAEDGDGGVDGGVDGGGADVVVDARWDTDLVLG